MILHWNSTVLSMTGAYIKCLQKIRSIMESVAYSFKSKPHCVSSSQSPIRKWSDWIQKDVSHLESRSKKVTETPQSLWSTTSNDRRTTLPVITLRANQYLKHSSESEAPCKENIDGHHLSVKPAWTSDTYCEQASLKGYDFMQPGILAVRDYVSRPSSWKD